MSESSWIALCKGGAREKTRTGKPSQVESSSSNKQQRWRGLTIPASACTKHAKLLKGLQTYDEETILSSVQVSVFILVSLSLSTRFCPCLRLFRPFGSSLTAFLSLVLWSYLEEPERRLVLLLQGEAVADHAPRVRGEPVELANLLRQVRQLHLWKCFERKKQKTHLVSTEASNALLQLDGSVTTYP